MLHDPDDASVVAETCGATLLAGPYGTYAPSHEAPSQGTLHLRENVSVQVMPPEPIVWQNDVCSNAMADVIDDDRWKAIIGDCISMTPGTWKGVGRGGLRGAAALEGVDAAVVSITDVIDDDPGRPSLAIALARRRRPSLAIALEWRPAPGRVLDAADCVRPTFTRRPLLLQLPMMGLVMK